MRDPDVLEGVEAENHRVVVPVVVTSFHASDVLRQEKVRTNHGLNRLLRQEMTTAISSWIPSNREGIPGKEFRS